MELEEVEVLGIVKSFSYRRRKPVQRYLTMHLPEEIVRILDCSHAGDVLVVGCSYESAVVSIYSTG